MAPRKIRPAKSGPIDQLVQFINAAQGQKFNRIINEAAMIEGAPPHRPVGRAIDTAEGIREVQRRQGGASAQQWAKLLEVKPPTRRRTSGISRAEGETLEMTPEALLANLAGTRERIQVSGREPEDIRTQGQSGKAWWEKALSGIARGADIVSRPSYGFWEALGEGSRGEFSDIPGGWWSGIKGEKKTNLSDIWNTPGLRAFRGSQGVVNPGADPTFGENVNELGPALAQSAARSRAEKPNPVSTFASDVVLYPGSWIGFGVTGASVRTLKEGITSGAERATRELAADAAERGVALSNRTARVNTQGARQALDDLYVDVRGGASRGRNTVDIIETPEGSRSALIDTVSNRAAEEYIARRKAVLEDWLERTKQGTTGRRAAPEEFNVYQQAVYAAAQVNQGKPNLAAIMRQAGDDAIESHLQDAARIIQHNIADEMMLAAQRGRRYAIRSGFMGGGNDLADYSRNVERALKAAYNVTGKITGPVSRSRPGQVASKIFSYKEHFPGLTSSIRQRVLSKGVREFDVWQRGLIKEFRDAGVTKTQLNEITKAIEEGYIISGVTRKGTPLADLQARVQDEYARIFAEEKAYFRAGDSVAADNYTYMWNRGDMRARSKFREDRKNAIRKQGTVPVEYRTDAAAAQGLRPERNALKNLIYRKGDSQRRFVQHWFTSEVLNSYGIRAGRAAKAGQRGLAKVNFKSIQGGIPHELRAMLKEGESWYIPKELEKVFDQFMRLMRTGNPDEVGALLRVFDTMTRQFKFWSTVPWPGFHIRNAIGDSFLSWLDGTGPQDFIEMTRARMAAMAGQPAYVRIAGQRVPFDLIKEEYLASSRASLFYHAGVGMNEFPTVGKMTDVARRGSEWREDYVRLVHFKSALDDEMSKRLPKGVKPTDIRWRNEWKKALVAARERVNKFNFDYSALTAIENSVMKRVIPFYTFTRKAVPLMFESLLTNPGRLNAMNQATNYLEELLGIEGMGLSEWTFPDYIQDPGWTQLSDGEEPWVWTQQALPTSQFGQLFGGGSLKETASSAVGQLATPFATMPIEWMSGYDFFTGQQRDKSFPEILLESFRPTATFNRVRGDTAPGWQNFLKDILGADIRQVSTEQQTAAVKRQQRALNAQVADINAELEQNGFRIRSQTRGKRRVWRLMQLQQDGSWKTIQEFNKSAEAQQAAQELSSR